LSEQHPEDWWRAIQSQEIRGELEPEVAKDLKLKSHIPVGPGLVIKGQRRLELER